MGREASSEAPLDGGVAEEEDSLDLDSWRSQSEDDKYPLLFNLFPSGGTLLVSLGNVIISFQYSLLSFF